MSRVEQSAGIVADSPGVLKGKLQFQWVAVVQREREPTPRLLAVGDDISKDSTRSCKDPTVIEVRRLAITSAIEGVQGIRTEKPSGKE